MVQVSVWWSSEFWGWHKKPDQKGAYWLTTLNLNVSNVRRALHYKKWTATHSDLTNVFNHLLFNLIHFGVCELLFGIFDRCIEMRVRVKKIPSSNHSYWSVDCEISSIFKSFHLGFSCIESICKYQRYLLYFLFVIPAGYWKFGKTWKLFHFMLS